MVWETGLGVLICYAMLGMGNSLAAIFWFRSHRGRGEEGGGGWRRRRVMDGRIGLGCLQDSSSNTVPFNCILLLFSDFDDMEELPYETVLLR
jgi:hypothetical protein